MINLDEQLKLFGIIGKELKDKAECMVIGGSAMMFYGAKENTKDVDLVFMNRKDMLKVKSVLYNAGFDEKKLIKLFKHYEIIETKPVMMEGRDTRFDLFVREVICFKIAESILDRIKEVHEFENLIVKVVSPEDIIVLKCATEREKDRIDAFELIQKFNINWQIIIDETKKQSELGEMIFSAFLYEFLLELKEDLKAEIPGSVLKEIRKIAEKAMVKIVKKSRRK